MAPTPQKYYTYAGFALLPTGTIFKIYRCPSGDLLVEVRSDVAITLTDARQLGWLVNLDKGIVE